MVSQHTLYFYDWDEVTREVEEASGRLHRDWNNMLSVDPNCEPFDFWLILLESGEIPNGGVREIDFVKLADAHLDKPWVQHVCAEYIKVLGRRPRLIKFWW